MKCKCGNEIDVANSSNVFLDRMCWDCFQKAKIEAEELRVKAKAKKELEDKEAAKQARADAKASKNMAVKAAQSDAIMDAKAEAKDAKESDDRRRHENVRAEVEREVRDRKEVPETKGNGNGNGNGNGGGNGNNGGGNGNGNGNGGKGGKGNNKD